MNEEKSEFPQTLQEAIKYFGNAEHAFNFLKGIRWPDGVVKCPRCGSTEVFFFVHAQNLEVQDKDAKTAVLRKGRDGFRGLAHLAG